MLEITADKIAYIGNIPITNTFLATLIASLFLIITGYVFSRKVSLIPGKFQNIIEFIIEFMFNTAQETVGEDRKTRDFFPLIATFFLFILISNWFGLLPIFNTVGFFDSFTHGKGVFTPLLKPVNSDLNITLALAIISTVATQYYAIKYVGIVEHLKRYFSLNPINLFVGILELVSEFTKVISLSFRLYGNILAGDIVILTFSSLVGLLLPLPFMGLEIVVGFVQAAVFAMLTLAFTSILTQKLH